MCMCVQFCHIEANLSSICTHHAMLLPFLTQKYLGRQHIQAFGAPSTAHKTQCTPFSPECSRCVPSPRGLTCCRRGGSWFGKCGNSAINPRNINFQHTWDEGLQVCAITTTRTTTRTTPTPTTQSTTTTMLIFTHSTGFCVFLCCKIIYCLPSWPYH